MKSIKDADISAQTRVLVRCDLDVAIEDGKVLDTFRLDCALPTLNYIIKKGAFPVIFGHMGRPGGKVDDSLSTNVLKPYFDEKLGSGNYE